MILTLTTIRTSNIMILALSTHATLPAWVIQLNMVMMRLTKDRFRGRNRQRKQTERRDHNYTDVICTGIFFQALKNFKCIGRAQV